MNKRYLIFTVLICLPLISMSQITDFKAHTYSDSAGNKLSYRILKPADYDSTDSYPLVRFLHGAGERGSNNFSQLKWGAAQFADPQMRYEYPAFVVAPQVPKKEVWSVLPLSQDHSKFSAAMPEEPTQTMKIGRASWREWDAIAKRADTGWSWK